MLWFTWIYLSLVAVVTFVCIFAPPKELPSRDAYIVRTLLFALAMVEVFRNMPRPWE